MPLIEIIDASPQPQYATQSQRAFPRPPSFADDVDEASLMLQQMQMAAKRKQALSQRVRFSGLAQTKTYIPNEEAIVTEDQRDYIIKYATAGAKAAAKFLAAAPARSKDAWNKSVFWYNEGAKLAKQTLSMSYVVNGARSPAWQSLALEAKEAVKNGDKWADKAKKLTADSSGTPVAQKPPTPQPEPETPPPVTIAPLKTAGFGTWWLVAGAAVVAFFAFRPTAKPDHLAGLEGG